jgi:large subunit ribosomal protein L21
MFAVIKSGGKQYKVAKNDVIRVEKLDAEAGASIDLSEVLMVATTLGKVLNGAGIALSAIGSIAAVSGLFVP